LEKWWYNVCIIHGEKIMGRHIFNLEGGDDFTNLGRVGLSLTVIINT